MKGKMWNTVIFKNKCLGLKIKFKVIFWDPVKHANVQISITNNEKWIGDPAYTCLMS